MKKGYKICPFCGEEIKEIAKKCRFCGEFLNKDEEKEEKHKHKNKIGDIIGIIISCIIIVPIMWYMDNDGSFLHKNFSNSLESYYCRGVGNTQWDSYIQVNNMYKKDSARGGEFSASERQEKRNNISKIYDVCILYKEVIKNDINKYSYLKDSIKIGNSSINNNTLAYCIGKRKYQQHIIERIKNKQFDIDIEFTPSVVIEDDSNIPEIIRGCVDTLIKNPSFLDNNKRD